MCALQYKVKHFTQRKFQGFLVHLTWIFLHLYLHILHLLLVYCMSMKFKLFKENFEKGKICLKILFFNLWGVNLRHFKRRKCNLVWKEMYLYIFFKRPWHANLNFKALVVNFSFWEAIGKIPNDFCVNHCGCFKFWFNTLVCCLHNVQFAANKYL